MQSNACTYHEDHYEIHLGITTEYIDCNPTASMTNNLPIGYHPNNRWVLSCKQQIIALSKVCNVNNTNVLETRDCCFLPSSNSTSTTLEVIVTLPDY
jgi:hypothetical protein